MRAHVPSSMLDLASSSPRHGKVPMIGDADLTDQGSRLSSLSTLIYGLRERIVADHELLRYLRVSLQSSLRYNPSAAGVDPPNGASHTIPAL